jgi:lysophospholipase L1-like esterase
MTNLHSDPYADRSLPAQGEAGDVPPRVRAFAALGDSFTAGTGCTPGRSWADLLAARLRLRAPDLIYVNLAKQGATTKDLERQVPEAVELEPDLVTVICGANDVFETVRPRPARAAARLAGALDAVRESVPGALMVTATVPERWRFLELRPRTQARVSRGVTELNELIRELARDHRIPCLDVASHPGLHDAENFSQDGLHPSELGHARAADGFERLLRVHIGDPEWGGAT